MRGFLCGVALVSLSGQVVLVSGCKKPQAKTLSVMQPDAEPPSGPLTASNVGACPHPYPGTNALAMDGIPASSATTNGSACAAKSAVLLSGTITDVPEFIESIAVQYRSPNYSSRDGATISQIVVHHTNAWVGSAISTLRSSSERVSAHLLVARNGDVVRLVSDDKKAWHAVDANRTSLGVEIEAFQKEQGLTAPQERMLLSVLRHWSKKYGIPRERILGHRSVVATLCPGWIWPKDSDLSAWLIKATPFLQ